MQNKPKRINEVSHLLKSIAALVTAFAALAGVLAQLIPTLAFHLPPTAATQSVYVEPAGFVSCGDVPTTPEEVRSVLQLQDNVEIGPPQPGCPDNQPGGWLIDPQGLGFTAALKPGMCIDFNGRATHFSNESALRWVLPTNWQTASAARAYIQASVDVTAQGLTVWWSTCNYQQP